MIKKVALKNKSFSKLIDFANSHLATNLILLFGILLRFIAYIFANPAINQHDVIKRYGHFDYAMYLFMYHKLPPMGGYEFAQPPINATLQALLMKFISLFRDYSDNYLYLYSHTKVLSLIYSIITLIIISKILSEFDIKKSIKNFILLIMATYPGIIIMTIQYSNDPISYMFFYLSLLLTIKWCKNKKLSTIVLLALSIGIGMLTKISVGLIAFVTGPMMLVVLIRSIISVNTTREGLISKNNTSSTSNTKIIYQLIIFALIVFPIGLSYSIRNYILFDIPIGAISEIAINTPLDMKNYNYSFVDRFLSFPFDRIINAESGIYHDYIEYNIWVDLIKTSTFDEFNFTGTIWHTLCNILYFLNFIFYGLGFITIILNVKDVIKNMISKEMRKNIIYDPTFNLKLISVILFILAITAYVSFNYKYQYSCNSNYRYISYITFAFAISIAIKYLQKCQK
ncbi:MAG: hypothetical protein J6P02_06160 [Lachnospiraceae bacterium]|nr:hypothetical protein [Lachnospiraceae bacterium]